MPMTIEQRLLRLAEAATEDSPAGWWQDASLLTGAPAFSSADRDFVVALDPASISRLARVVEAARLEHATHDHRVVPCDIWVCQVLAVLDADAPEGGTK